MPLTRLLLHEASLETFKRDSAKVRFGTWKVTLLIVERLLRQGNESASTKEVSYHEGRDLPRQKLQMRLSRRRQRARTQ